MTKAFIDLGQDEGLTSHSTFAHSSFTACDDDDLLDTSYFRFLGRCSSSGDSRRGIRVASWDTLWTEAISSCSGWLDGHTSGFSCERALAVTCRVLCGRRKGRRHAKGRRGRCIMVEWRDVCKSHSSKIHLGNNSNNPRLCASFPNHSSAVTSPSPSDTPCSPSDTLSTPSLPACTSPRPRRSFTTKLHTRPHRPLSAHAPSQHPHRSAYRHLRSFAFFPCIYVARYLKIFLPHLMER